ncbi:uncharacterized protein LOC131146419 isoform X3 [Malania oleifera]|uniref:uncharacterized protein LOC131146419 isoform X3 n=1 Tax=Malania oleifera TaxID=397392 RepID=UPI0025ADE65D|nr:uncharacterized protein LOC131146419 isoform X3 [Malania oleifera]
MSSESGDQCSTVQLESDKSNQEIKKKWKISYTRDFILSLSELDACQELPSGFDPSILLEFEDENNGISGEYYRGICGKWENISSGPSDKDCHSDSGRQYGNQYRRSWQNPEHDGLLGKGAFPRVSGYVAGALAPKVRGNDHQQLNRTHEPYRPPRPYKAVLNSGRESKDSYNDETFGSAECLSQEREEEEKRRRDSFELMRKEQKKAIEEKQKQIADEHKENVYPDIARSVEDKGNDKRLVNKSNELEDYVAPLASNNDSSKSSFSTQTPAARPLVPPGFTNRISGKDLGTETLNCSSRREAGNDEFEDSLPSGKSKPGAMMASVEEIHMDKHVGSSYQQHEPESITVPFRNESKKIAVSSFDVFGFDSSSHTVSNLSEVRAAREEEDTNSGKGVVTGDNMTMLGEDHSALTLDKSSDNGTVNSGDSSSFIKHYDIGANCSESPITITSKFSHWFLDGEEKQAGGISSGNVTGRSLAHGMSIGKGSEHNLPTVSSESKEVTYKLTTSVTDGISEQLYSSNEPAVDARILTCEDLEQSILSEVSGQCPFQQVSVQDKGARVSEYEQPNAGSDNSASQHLLSLLRKGTSLEHLAASSKQNMGSFHGQSFEILGNSYGHNTSTRGNAETSENSILKPQPGSGFMEELKSTEGLVPVQRVSVHRVPRNDVSHSFGFSSPVSDSDLCPSIVEKDRSIGISCEGILASNCGKQIGLDMLHTNRTVSDNAPAGIGSSLQLGQGMKVSPVTKFDVAADLATEICLPEEDSLITVDDPIIPLRSMSMASENAVKGLEGPPFLHGSYDVTGLETPYHNLRMQGSHPQFRHIHMNHGRHYFHPAGSPQVHMSPQIKSMDVKSYYNLSPPDHDFMASLHLRPSLRVRAEATGFDNPVHRSLLQQMHVPGNLSSPHSHSINQMALSTGELNPMQSFHLNHQQPGYGGVRMPNQDAVGVGGSNNQLPLERLLELELRAKQLHPSAVAVRGQGTYGRQVDMGNWHQNRSLW